MTQDTSYVDFILEFIHQRKRPRKFTSLATLTRWLGSLRKAREFIRVAVLLGLGRRKNETNRQRPGIEWDTAQTRGI